MTRSSRDKTNFKVGLFVISLFLVLSATAIFLAVQKRPVGSAQVFQLSTQSASGLTVGMPLFYSGFEVGELTSLTLTRAGTVQVEVEVLEEHQFRINKTSVFSLEQPLIGMTRLNVKTEDLNARAAEPSHVFGLEHIS